jgi:cytochrome c-type biogenesis protein CcmH
VITFWIVAGLLMAAALSIVMLPLLRRGERRHPAAEKLAHVTIFHQQLEELEADLAKGVLSAEDYEQGRAEIEQRLLEESSVGGTNAHAPAAAGWRRWFLPGAMVVAVPVFVVALYYQVGNPGMLMLDAPMTAGMPHQVDAKQVQLMASRLAARLKQNPDDADGWQMLAKSYGMMQRYNDATAAFAKAAALAPQNVQLLADYADVLAMAQGGRFEGKPSEVISQALRIDPNHPKALALAGSAAFETKSYAMAIDLWQRLLTKIPADSPYAASVRSNIAEAQQRGGITLASLSSKSPAARRASVKGVVRLIDQLKDKVSPGDTVFVYAIAPDGGPKMPLAVLKKEAKDLPLAFALDDTMAVMPQAKLSDFKRVVLRVLVSKSGMAKPQSGDYVSAPTPASIGDGNVELLVRGVVK